MTVEQDAPRGPAARPAAPPTSSAPDSAWSSFPAPPPRGLLRRGLDALYLGAGVAAGVFLIAILLLMLGLALGRQVGVNIPAGDEFAAWSMAAMAFLGLAHTFKAGDMIRVGLLVDRLRGRTRRLAEIVALTIGVVFVGYFAWHATQFTWLSYQLGDRAQGVLPVPLWIPQLGYAGGLVLLAIAFLDELVLVLRGGKPSYERDPPATAEEAVERAASSAV